MSLVLKNNWQPTASIEALKQRSEIIRTIRAFFDQRNIMEVDTPLLCRATVTDPFLNSLSLSYKDESWFLQTSPEYAMKRLLASGSGPIYQICKAFRADECGRCHNPEFTMLEWYRPGFNHHDLMDEMDELLQVVLHGKKAERYAYAELFKFYFDINPHTISLDSLKNIATNKALTVVGDNLDRDDFLQLLMAEFVEPHLGKNQPTFVYDFPATQAALARIRQEEIPVAERFEVYIKGIELANGFHELADSHEQRQRFEKDLQKRRQLGYSLVPVDEYLLNALDHFPDCAGVALGIDRLIMIALQKTNISEIISFNSNAV